MSKTTKSKPTGKRSRTPSSAAAGPIPKLAVHVAGGRKNEIADVGSMRTRADSKQSRVITMLQSPAGVTIAAMMDATGWQQHSVRGFLAGVVRKRLKLKLDSKKVNGKRIYLIHNAGGGKDRAHPSKRHSS